ncbi:MAG TPA: aromatic ring-hydroxylating dioxygenase subunit alpha [Streptosporangiaceae bacterium]|nr:aromatic ring-hydroxylating dioxygenase subunit alpha [Streptosporangiaceae bacterium]
MAVGADGAGSPPSVAARDAAWLPDIMATHEVGRALPGTFYTHPDLYELELARIWYQGWLFAAVASELPGPGSYVVYTVGTCSAILVRQRDGSVAAYHNVCRHRGSLLADQPAGQVRNFTCPYHQWTYGLDGSLRACRAMPADLDKPRHSLLPVHAAEIAGLIFISFAATPPQFGEAGRLLAAMAAPQGLDRAKVAHVADYEIAANWKLVLENNRECYHCDVSHPQYVAANYDRYDAGDMPAPLARELAEVTRRSEERWAARGLAVTHAEGGLARFPSADGSIWYSANRTPLVPGYTSESMDGARVAPLMGSYPDPDVGVLRLRTLPNFWQHGSCDHAVITRLTPSGPGSTTARVMWLVDAEAREGPDYDLRTLLPFWQLTAEQDWQICARQQLGVRSPAYLPGPLSPAKEYNVMAFHAWYQRALASPQT